MTREIKFRAWDEQECRMVYDFRNTDKKAFLNENGQLVRSTWHTLMQYTGLKDKNGKEIYEGDVVKPVQTKGTRWKLATVEYQRGEFVILPKGEALSFKTLTETGWLKIEVIGNIYQTPELLNN